MHDIAAALAHFKKVDPILYKAAKKVEAHLTARKPLRGPTALFNSLCESVVSQQLSVKASDTIWKRVQEVCGGTVSPDALIKASLPRLRKAGLSAAKTKTLKELAKAVQGGLNLGALRKSTPEEATEALVAVWGIGPWTAEMFLMFGLSHSDIFSSRDLGLARSMETLYNLKKPSRERLEKIALAWSPHRTIACRVLWRVRDM